MKPKENNLEKNISRLVKLTGDADKVSGEFVDSVMEDALDELKTPGAGAKREKSGKSAKSKWPKIFAYAAAVIIVSGIVVALTLPAHYNRVRLYARKAVWSDVIDGDSRPGIEQSFKLEAEKSVVAERSEKGKIVVVESSDKSEANFNENHVADKGVTGGTFSSDASPTTLDKSLKLYVVVGPSDAIPPPSPKSDKLMELYNEASRGGPIALKEAKKEHEVAFGVRIPGAMGLEGSPSLRSLQPIASKKQAGIFLRETGTRSYPMAHGGTTPPNGEDVDGMLFKNYGVNPFVDTEDDHLSTFATDVDTGSYTVVRRYLHDGHLPPEKAVRVEEFVNYFNYGYAAPQEENFAVYAEASPWRFGTGRKNSYLLRLGLKGKQVSEESRKPAILTFVIDVSGSMKRENRLGLVKRSLRMLVERLRGEDRIGIAVYGSRGRKEMDHRGLYDKAEILATIESLQAGGSTFAEEGIRIGYGMAENAYRRGYINRVILCSDGVANVGRTGADDILRIIKKKAEKGITLSAIGFGMGNYNDVLLETLGDKGNGHYVYIDTIAEARRVFEDNLTGTLQVIGRDVKVQVDFNPKVVRSYRLIGYENRDVPDEKFRDDKYDGGEIGAGHSVTALYELKLWPGKEGTVATTYVRYKHADTSAVTEFKSHIAVEDFNRNIDGSSSGFKLAATVTEFAEILRKSYWAKGATLDGVLERAQQLSRGFEGDGDVIELVDLISKAERLMKKVEVDIFEIRESFEAGEGEDEFLRP
jgi:Ca-activated chloride channel family protein